MTDVFKLFTAGLISIGSATTIILGLSTWLGKIWANRILINEKNALEVEMIKRKAEIDQELNNIRFTHDKLIQSRDLAVDSKLAYEIHKQYLDFADSYIKKVREVLNKMIGSGPTQDALDYERELRNLRLNSYLFIPADVNKELSDFEYKIRIVGAQARLSKNTDSQTTRNSALENADKLLFEIIGSTDNDKDVNAEELLNMVKESFGISALNKILIESLSINN